jgi:site-specific DNA recombinase
MMGWLASILTSGPARKAPGLLLVVLTIALFLMNLRRAGERAGRVAERLSISEKIHEIQRQMSFAQFEREVTAERIRDKIAASKKKGLWMGATRPLGYDTHPDPMRRELVINPGEAETVQSLFRLYDATPNLRLLAIEAARLGLHPRLSPKEAAAAADQRRFGHGQLHYLLTNVIYRGRIRHRETDYPGQHPAIIDKDLWDRVQAKLQSSGARPRGRSTDPAPTRCLSGKLRDDTGDLLTPTHTERRGRRYSYYISHRLIRGGRDANAWRLSAPELEATLGDIVTGHLRQAAKGQTTLSNPDASDGVRLDNTINDLCGIRNPISGFACPLPSWRQICSLSSSKAVSRRTSPWPS